MINVAFLYQLKNIFRKHKRSFLQYSLIPEKNNRLDLKQQQNVQKYIHIVQMNRVMNYFVLRWKFLLCKRTECKMLHFLQYTRTHARTHNMFFSVFKDLKHKHEGTNITA